MTTPTLDQLKHAITISEQIESLKQELAAVLGGDSAPVVEVAPAPAAKAQGRKKGTMSSAGRARIAAAQKLRWSKIKGQKPAPVSKAPAKTKAEAPAAAPTKKSGFSKAHTAKLAAAAKARWAKIRAGKAPNPFASKKK